MNPRGYFDYAAATPVDPRVIEAMQPFISERFGNPSSPHQRGKEMRSALEAARAAVAHQLGAKKAEITFTASSTEAALIAIQGVAKAFPGSTAITSAIEHQAVLAPLEAGFGKAQVRTVGVGTTGIVDVEALVGAVDDTTVLVCLQYANNEIGTLQPVAKVAAALGQIRRDRGNGLPLYFYCDAAQAGLLTLQVSRLGFDLLSMGGSKIYGPSGSGFLYKRTGTQLEAPMAGGGQEDGLRGGTENVGAAVGLAKALELVQEGRSTESKRLEVLRNELWETIVQRIPGVTLNGSLEHRLPGNLNISISGCSGEDLVAYLDAAGFAVATGAACTAAHQDPSHVLVALGITRAAAESSLRISMGRFSQATELESFLSILEAAVTKIRGNSAKGKHQVQ